MSFSCARGLAVQYTAAFRVFIYGGRLDTPSAIGLPPFLLLTKAFRRLTVFSDNLIMSSNYTILTGRVWKEYGSKKLILTLNGARAGALEAAIPLWISLVGPLTWIVIQYVWFQCSALRGTRRHPFRPLYYRQKQVLLRNSSGDLGTV
jgi:hypothetical protein